MLLINTGWLKKDEANFKRWEYAPKQKKTHHRMHGLKWNAKALEVKTFHPSAPKMSRCGSSRIRPTASVLILGWPFTVSKISVHNLSFSHLSTTSIRTRTEKGSCFSQSPLCNSANVLELSNSLWGKSDPYSRAASQLFSLVILYMICISTFSALLHPL